MRRVAAPPLLLLLACLLATPAAPAAELLKRVRSAAQPGVAAAIQVEDRPLVLTGQLFPADATGTVAGDGPAQTRQLFANLKRLLADLAATPGDVVRLNVYVADESLAALLPPALTELFGDAPPTVATVRSALTEERALLALDAVIARPAPPEARPSARVPWAVLPAGRKVFISGQGQRDPDLGLSTRHTMTSLGKGLAHLGVGPAQVVHVKAFLGPVREHARVRQEIAAFFAGAPVPPIVFVEWVSSLPIEIELVATGPATGSAPEHLQHHRLPGLTPSPRYSHAATVEPGSPLIFTSGLYGQGGPDARREWQEIFAELGATLFAAGGGFRHLVKATYYNADANGQRVLGEIRDVYYDPARPPAASAAVVKGVGLPGKTAMMEVIGVPLRVSR